VPVVRTGGIRKAPKRDCDFGSPNIIFSQSPLRTQRYYVNILQALYLANSEMGENNFRSGRLFLVLKILSLPTVQAHSAYSVCFWLLIFGPQQEALVKHSLILMIIFKISVSVTRML